MPMPSLVLLYPSYFLTYTNQVKRYDRRWFTIKYNATPLQSILPAGGVLYYILW